MKLETDPFRTTLSPAVHKFYGDGNLLRNDRRIEWIMLSFAENKLKRVLTGRQFDACFSLPGPRI